MVDCAMWWLQPGFSPLLEPYTSQPIVGGYNPASAVVVVMAAQCLGVAVQKRQVMDDSLGVSARLSSGWSGAAQLERHRGLERLGGSGLDGRGWSSSRSQRGGGQQLLPRGNTVMGWGGGSWTALLGVSSCQHGFTTPRARRHGSRIHV